MPDGRIMVTRYLDSLKPVAKRERLASLSIYRAALVPAAGSMREYQ